MVQENDLFNPADFESIEVDIYFKNLSTGKTPINGKQVAVVEVSEKSITLSLPDGSCSIDNHVMVDIYRGEEQLFSSTAKAREIQETDDGPLLVLLELIQFEKKSWEDFLTIFFKRQTEISEFFAAGKR